MKDVSDENYKKHLELRKEIKERTDLLKKDWNKINICLVGYSGAGKSSFVIKLKAIKNFFIASYSNSNKKTKIRFEHS